MSKLSDSGKEKALNALTTALDEAKKLRDMLETALEKTNNLIDSVEKEIEQFTLEQGLYRPMSDLDEYDLHHIESITFVCRDKDGNTYSNISGGFVFVNDMEVYNTMLEVYGCPPFSLALCYDPENDEYRYWCRSGDTAYSHKLNYELLGFIDIHVRADKESGDE